MELYLKSRGKDNKPTDNIQDNAAFSLRRRSAQSFFPKGQKVNCVRLYFSKIHIYSAQQSQKKSNKKHMQQALHKAYSFYKSFRTIALPITNILLFIVQASVNGAGSTGSFGKGGVGQISDRNATEIVPAGMTQILKLTTCRLRILNLGCDLCPTGSLLVGASAILVFGAITETGSHFGHGWR